MGVDATGQELDFASVDFRSKKDEFGVFLIVGVIEYPDGRIALRHDGVDLPYRVFDQEPRVAQAAIVQNKFFGPLLEQIREQQLQRDAGSKPRRGLRPARDVQVR